MPLVFFNNSCVNIRETEERYCVREGSEEEESGGKKREEGGERGRKREEKADKACRTVCVSVR